MQTSENHCKLKSRVIGKGQIDKQAKVKKNDRERERETSPTGQQSRAKLHKTTQLHTTHNFITSYYILNILHTYYILTYYILTYILTYLHYYILT